MEAGRTSGAFHSNWFNYVDIPGIDPGKMTYAVLKDECRDQFREAVQAKREEQLLAFQKFKEDARKRGTSVRLTDAQLEHLSASYDPREMTREEYQAFIDDLCEYRRALSAVRQGFRVQRRQYPELVQVSLHLRVFQSGYQPL